MKPIYQKDMSQTIISDPINLDQFDVWFVQFYVSEGNPIGEIHLEITNDSGWWDILPSSSKAISGITGGSWTGRDIPAKVMRVVYTPTSGTGTLNVTLRGKNMFQRTAFEFL